MGYLFGQRGGDRGQLMTAQQQREFADWGITSPADLIPPRPFARMGAPVVTQESALRHSAVWACLRLRADLISTMPADVFRRVADVQVECPKPPVLVNPAKRDMTRGDTGIVEWLYSSQVDLDRAGNAIGLITEVDGLGLPAKVELQPAAATACLVRDNQIWKYRINGTLYDPSVVWHERAYTVPGLHVGLSPIAYAAWAIGEYLSVQEFATDWFAGGAVPRSRLKNTAKTLNPKEAAIVKESWRASVAAGEPFVHGSDWDYEFIQAQSASADWLDAKKYSITDVARFFGVPGDMIDSAATGASGHIVYANINQRNMQLLIMNLGPAIIRRETALSGWLPRPRYVKINTDALLRLDPASRAIAISQQIADRVLTNTEARELDNRPPLTDDQIDEFERIYGAPGTGSPASPAVGLLMPPAVDPATGTGDLAGIESGAGIAAIGPGSG